jgi:hypothetical protein
MRFSVVTTTRVNGMAAHVVAGAAVKPGKVARARLAAVTEAHDRMVRGGGVVCGHVVGGVVAMHHVHAGGRTVAVVTVAAV